MKRILSLVFWIFLIPNMASAQELDIWVGPSEIYTGEQVQIVCFYTGENISDNASLHAVITKPIIATVVLEKLNETHFSSQYEPQVSGNYTIHCTDDVNTSDETGFQVIKLILEITDCPSKNYTNEQLNITARLEKKIWNYVEEIDSPDVNFNVFLGSEELTIENGYPFFDGLWNIMTENLSRFETVDYFLRLEAEYEDRVVSAEKSFSLLPEYEFDILSVSPMEVNEGQTVTVNLHAVYQNTSMLEQGIISASLGGQSLDIESAEEGFMFVAPGLSPDSYELSVNLKYNNLNLSESETLVYLIRIYGDMVDVNGKSISGSLRFEKDGYSKSISFSGGEYSGSIPSGTYTVEASFPDVKASFTEVLVEGKLSDIIRFDGFKSLDRIYGFRIAKVFALEFYPGFDRAYIDAVYDSSKVFDEESVQVYKCYDWDMDSRSCDGSWRGIDADVNPATNRVDFKADSLSAFMIGERIDLRLEARLDKDEYYIGEKVKLSGVVKDDRGATVPDVFLRCILGSGSKEIYSNHNGVFSAEFNVPDDTGAHLLLVNASKGYYNPVSIVKEFNVLKKSDITMVLPLKADMKPDNEYSLEISIINSGQQTLRNITIDLDGIPEEWFTLLPGKFESIKPGEEKKLIISVKPFEPDKSLYTAAVKFQSNELSESDTFVLAVNVPKNQTAESDAENETSEGENVISGWVSSYLVSNSTALINIGSIAASVIIVMVLLVKTKSKGRTEKARENVKAFIYDVKKEVMKTKRNKG